MFLPVECTTNQQTIEDLSRERRRITFDEENSRHAISSLSRERLREFYGKDTSTKRLLMILHVREAKYLHDHVIWLRFNDGSEGEFDLRDERDGEVFESLKDLSNFRQFTVDCEIWIYSYHTSSLSPPGNR